jgi:hypothetical protein
MYLYESSKKLSKFTQKKTTENNDLTMVLMRNNHLVFISRISMNFKRHREYSLYVRSNLEHHPYVQYLEMLVAMFHAPIDQWKISVRM